MAFVPEAATKAALKVLSIVPEGHQSRTDALPISITYSMILLSEEILHFSDTKTS
jgi:hypothetical protein